MRLRGNNGTLQTCKAGSRRLRCPLCAPQVAPALMPQDLHMRRCQCIRCVLCYTLCPCAPVCAPQVAPALMPQDLPGVEQLILQLKQQQLALP